MVQDTRVSPTKANSQSRIDGCLSCRLIFNEVTEISAVGNIDDLHSWMHQLVTAAKAVRFQQVCEELWTEDCGRACECACECVCMSDGAYAMVYLERCAWICCVLVLCLVSVSVCGRSHAFPRGLLSELDHQTCTPLLCWPVWGQGLGFFFLFFFFGNIPVALGAFSLQ